ncbi:MAG: GTP cyclohydrolase, partial [Elusimicrobia bacterium]|nr:GTP cyclohydrolase [Elusimicrobiota bacterium]
MFTVKKIEFKDIDKFIKLPYKIYKDNPYWIPQLDSENKKMLSDKNPYWKHAKRQLFLAYDEENNIVGRIAAIIDHNYIEFQETEIVFFGFFECIDNIDVAKLLFTA